MNEKNLPKMVVLFMGKPGSGKGTQAEILVEKYGLNHFNTGDIIRHRLANPKTDADRHEKELYDSGVLNTPEWVANLVCEKAHEYAVAGEGIVFSGSPRTIFEAERLIPQLIADYGKDNVVAILLDVDDNYAVGRNSSRLSCDKCGFTMTVGAENLEKMKNSACPKCGGKMIQRTIDTAEKIMDTRLPEFMNRTMPAVNFIKERGILREIDGRPSSDEVAKAVAEVVDPVAQKLA